MYHKKVMRKFFFAGAVLLLFASLLSVTSLVRAPAADWVNPTGYSDPDSRWTYETYAYDDNLNTAALWSQSGYPLPWGGFLELTLTSAIQCNKIRYYISSSDTQINRIDVDVYKDGSWVNVYEGSFSKVSWIEQSFTEGSVTRARFRFGSSYSLGGTGRLAEFDFWGAPPAQPPVASFTESAETVTVGDTISFDASASSDPDGTIVSYSWNFGDGTTGTGVTTTHAYAAAGTYTVTLTVTDNEGLTDTETATKTVQPPPEPPVASFTESATTVTVGETISFDASGSYDSDGTIVNYEWNFGDGTTATGVTATHVYSAPGTYTVTLTVTDDDGLTDTETATKTIIPPKVAPVASFTESAEVVVAGTPINFDPSGSYDLDETIVLYEWDWESDGVYDQRTTTPDPVSHTYTTPGTYTVTLRVTDDDGLTDTATATKTVEPKIPPGPGIPEFSLSATIITSIAAAIYVLTKRRLSIRNQ